MLFVFLFAFAAARTAAADPSSEELLKTFNSEFVAVTPGKGAFPQSFEQGSAANDIEQPVHRVTLTRDFAIAKYEVPQNLYEGVMGTNPSRWKGPRNSAESMTWHEANDFCQKTTKLMRERKLIAEDEVIRLPTESEWEYCCRAGTTTDYSFGASAQAEGDDSPKASVLDAYAWHTGNAAGNDPAVGALKPNPWGLYDMHGYLWEFCADGWHEDYIHVPTNGAAASSDHEVPESVRYVIRGGSWKDEFPALRSASRRFVPVSFKDDAIGFRCVKARH
jgi:formylglycine-generating enzyme required for sulfatase activity